MIRNLEIKTKWVNRLKNLNHLFFDVLIFLLEQAELKVNVQVITDRIYAVVQCNSGYDTSLS